MQNAGLCLTTGASVNHTVGTVLGLNRCTYLLPTFFGGDQMTPSPPPSLCGALSFVSVQMVAVR